MPEIPRSYDPAPGIPASMPAGQAAPLPSTPAPRHATAVAAPLRPDFEALARAELVQLETQDAELALEGRRLFDALQETRRRRHLVSCRLQALQRYLAPPEKEDQDDVPF